MLRATARLLLVYLGGVAMLYFGLPLLGISEGGAFAFLFGAPALLLPLLAELVLAAVRGVPPRELVATWALAGLAMIMLVWPGGIFVTPIALTLAVASGHLSPGPSRHQ